MRFRPTRMRTPEECDIMSNQNIRAGVVDDSKGDRNRALATAVLEFFSSAASSAEGLLSSDRLVGASAFANVHTLNTAAALENMGSISAEKRKALIDQIREPAIARLVTIDENDQQEELFIFRGTPYAEGSGRRVASYRSPLGRLAALDVGDDIELKTKQRGESQIRYFESLEKTELRPCKVAGEWDSVNSVVYRLNESPITIVSLRDLLHEAGIPEDELDALEAVLREAEASDNVFLGLRRSVVRKMELRDRPLLDKVQDEIFRLPIQSRLALLGPPGSGKTTTLIKRLGLKLDTHYLEQDEQRLIGQSQAGLAAHSSSWMMFTPTELLKLYVKEAFNREGVPAPESRMKTWDSYRREIARTSLAILRSGNMTGGSVMRQDLPSLRREAIDDPVGWYEDFDDWQQAAFWSDLEAAASTLDRSLDARYRSLTYRLLRAVAGSRKSPSVSRLVVLERLSSDLDPIAREIGDDVRETLKRSFSRYVGSAGEKLDELAHFLESTAATAPEDLDDADVDEDDEESDSLSSRGRRNQAFDAYLKAMRAVARAAVRGRKPGANTRAGRILEWLGDRVPPTDELSRLGRSLDQQVALRRFRSPTRRYLSQLKTRYRSFRIAVRSDEKWYQPDGYRAFELAPLEVDIIILAILRNARELLRQPAIASRLDDDGFEMLSTIRGMWVNQVVADEATDFSPIQLASMVSLVDQATGGFVACGDFNQRITSWGSRSIEQMGWALPGLQTRPIRITYRHSRQLNELAKALAGVSGDIETSAELPTNVVNEGVPPVLGLSLKAEAETRWLVDRIGEIEDLTGSLPSIAVLVNCEAEVQPMADALDNALADHNIKAVACPNGLVVGQDNDVRIFSVEHIKGLEFEAVFFSKIDRLAETMPGAFDKLLYVGATRAAMYFGITSTQSGLPGALDASISPLFAGEWNRA